jgi:hypothetical protein
MGLKNVEGNHMVEMIHIWHISTDENGNLKFMQREEFRDHKAFSEALEAVEAKMANK